MQTCKVMYFEYILLFNMLCSSDMIRRRNLRTRSIKMLVLDEADEMLNKGMTNKLYQIGEVLI